MAEENIGYHRPVLLRQVLEALAIRPDGIYLDGTAGGGGHAAAIAFRLQGIHHPGLCSYR